VRDDRAQLEVDDEELAAEALAADPLPSLEGAMPFSLAIGEPDRRILPEWYMPAPSGGGIHLGGWRRNVVFVFVAALLVIEVTGLCTTYGRVF
jgi:hypothetical protein